MNDAVFCGGGYCIAISLKIQCNRNSGSGCGERRLRQHVRPDAQFYRSDRKIMVERWSGRQSNQRIHINRYPAWRSGNHDHVVSSTLLHHGMIIVGVPYTCQAIEHGRNQRWFPPYGARTLAGNDGSRQPSENELEIARFQGRHVAEITRKQCA